MSPKQPYQGSARLYLDDGDDRRLTCAYTKHFHPFRLTHEVLVPRECFAGVETAFFFLRRLAATVACCQWPKYGQADQCTAGIARRACAPVEY